MVLYNLAASKACLPVSRAYYAIVWYLMHICKYWLPTHNWLISYVESKFWHLCHYSIDIVLNSKYWYHTSLHWTQCLGLSAQLGHTDQASAVSLIQTGHRSFVLYVKKWQESLRKYMSIGYQSLVLVKFWESNKTT